MNFLCFILTIPTHIIQQVAAHFSIPRVQEPLREKSAFFVPAREEISPTRVTSAQTRAGLTRRGRGRERGRGRRETTARGRANAERGRGKGAKESSHEMKREHLHHINQLEEVEERSNKHKLRNQLEEVEEWSNQLIHIEPEDTIHAPLVDFNEPPNGNPEEIQVTQTSPE
jgi:hypothetical protein